MDKEVNLNYIFLCPSHNGSPTHLFKASRGIRKGAPLSPFLFAIMAEALSALLIKAKDIGLIRGFEERHNGEVISHLQYADGTILFSSILREKIIALRRILKFFQLILGLKVNLSKSSLVGIGCSEVVVRSLASIIHLRVGKLPMTSLDLLNGVRANSQALWNPVIERIETKLTT